MRIGIGDGGWVGVDEVGLPGLLYVRVREIERRLRIVELYIDGSHADGIDATHLRNVPLSHIEARINDHGELLAEKMQHPAVDLSTLASYYGSATYTEGDDWVAQSLRIQRSGDNAVPRRRPELRGGETRDDFRLVSGPPDGLTDEFLQDVARAYRAARDRGEKPNVSIAEQTGYPVKSVQRWVYLARQRGIMPRGQRGKVG